MVSSLLEPGRVSSLDVPVKMGIEINLAVEMAR